MIGKQSHRLAGVLGVTLTVTLLVVIGVSTPGSGRSLEGEGVLPSHHASFTPYALPAGSPAEGIKVHGQWTIEVRETDGTLVSRHEFENELTDCGAAILAGVLATVGDFGRWLVVLDLGKDSPRIELEEGNGLNITFPTIGRDAGKMVLSGVENTFTGLIDRVRTITAVKNFGLLLEVPCRGVEGPASFTERIIPRVQVEKQDVIVTVAISYS